MQELSPIRFTYDVQKGIAASISLMDMSRGTLTHFTEAESGQARWSPDGTRVAFSAAHTGMLNLYGKAVGSNGPDEELFVSKEAKNLSDWSPDGKYLLFSSQSPATARDVWALPLSGSDRKPFPVVQTAAEETSGRFAPDGKHVAYVSDETGRYEVFVRPFPGPGAASRVSIGGGDGPFWRRDGKELYYSSSEGQLMAVPISVSSKGALDVGLPRALFKTPGFVAPDSDGQRFLFLAPLGDTSTPPITVIINWADQEK